MAGKLLFMALLYAACLTGLECNCWSCGRRASSIRKLFSTKEPIWIYSTTGPTKLRCLVDVVITMERMSVNFTRSCYNRGHKVSRSLHGIFDQHRKNHMDVKTAVPEPLFNFQEDLLFMSDDNSCAVVMTTTNVCGKNLRYDLRIMNDFITKPPLKKCLKWFHKYEKHGIVLYDPSCQHILAQRGTSQPYGQEKERCKGGIH
ncbi:uncharacterized protein [Dermacentor albipictus]|uniref:uncharacterized protein isoform X1 n=1 Tax=Dermacentor albipictus TaxID=60249 RepID=UPI0038FC61B5